MCRRTHHLSWFLFSATLSTALQVSLPDRYPSNGALLRNVPDACYMNLISGFHSCYTNSIPLYWCRCYDGTPLTFNFTGYAMELSDLGNISWGINRHESFHFFLWVMANQACMVFDFFCLFIAWHFETTIAPRKRERNILVPFPSMYALWFSS